MKIKYITCAFIFTSLMLSCGSTKNAISPDDKFIGEWNLVTKDTPQGDVPVTMTISKDKAENFVGTLTSMIGEITMSNLILKNGAISCDFEVQGIFFEFRGVFDRNEFKGQTLGPSESYITIGKKME